jgi:hypothetical protein
VLIKRTMTSIVSQSIVVGEESHPIVRCNEVRILLDEFYGGMKELTGECFFGRINDKHLLRSSIVFRSFRHTQGGRW